MSISGQGKFITFFCAILDGAARRLTYCNAGYNPPILISAQGELRTLDRGEAVLGEFESGSYDQQEIELRPGDHRLYSPTE